MLTRGARKARVAVRPEAAHEALPPLPLPCVLDVLSRLAPGERLLASAVSRAWRAAVCQSLLWARVDLTQGVTDALLRAVVDKAAGQLKSLRLNLRRRGVSTGCVLTAVTANAGNLRWLDLRSTRFHAFSNLIVGFVCRRTKSTRCYVLRLAFALSTRTCSAPFKTPERCWLAKECTAWCTFDGWLWKVFQSTR